jgi:XTP/dITP diphosphohydrolase
MQLLIATSNPGKFKEISEVFNNLSVELLNLKDLGVDSQVEENGSSYKENARIKAAHFHEITGLPTLGEDSGIVVEALKDELGMHTRRWGAGAEASDQEWIDHFMSVMQNHPDNRGAKFFSHMYFINGNTEHHVIGETLGLITPELEAPIYEGLPLSSCFKPEGKDKVYSAMSEDEKNEISHRGEAAWQMLDYLKSFFDEQN